MSGNNGVKLRKGRCARRQSWLAAAAIIGLASTPGLAQTLDTTGTFAANKLSNAPDASYGAPPLPKPEALVPELGDYLQPYGAAVLLNTINEFDGIVKGLNKGSTNAGQYGLEWDQDWDILAGLHGFQTHTIAVGRYGIPTSRIFGDNLNPSQEIYGAGGNVVVHLVFFYGEETLAHGRFALAFGRFPSQNDFLASPLNCNFMQNSLCGNPKAVGDNVSNSSYPDANWAVRLRVRPIAPVYVQAGIYFTEKNIYNATDGMRSGFHLNSSNINGEFFPVEIGFEPKLGEDKMPGHYKLGGSYDNNDHSDNYFDVDGSAFAQTGLPRRVRKGGSQGWASADQMLVRQGPGATDGIIVLADFVHNDPRYSTRANEILGAVLDRHFWDARPFDTIGAEFAYTEVSGLLGKTEALQEELGEPITGTGQFYDGIKPGVQTHTMDFELNYQIHVFRGITFAPDFQYFIRPNAQKNLPDAALLGFKSNIELF